ncbi:site-2 protease family protein [Parabacteroides sp. FAFU027]|uniref:site-2 protease family protein n=1 Tax=Parabacteroides sp. FAFU027 TaxID=2922715 RepID=UPI001FAF5854|nr:site-2 protease family protein [Parabacteroides sp. FAFU027]
MNITQTIEIIPAAVIGLTVHEFAHAFTAYKLGDNTAKEQGRVSLNPLKHIDWLGFFLIVIAGFGWAKPVLFNPDNLKKKHRDEILIAIAGPFSNFVLALLFLAIARGLYAAEFFQSTHLGLQVINLLIIWGVINFGLFVFNLIPLPPLDGSHLYLSYLKEINPTLMYNLYRYGTFALFAIIILQNQTSLTILPISNMVNSVSVFFLDLLAFN